VTYAKGEAMFASFHPPEFVDLSVTDWRVVKETTALVTEVRPTPIVGELLWLSLLVDTVVI
jgi:hypothetical protein